MGDRSVHKGVRMLVIPASMEIYREALKAGMIEHSSTGRSRPEPLLRPLHGSHMGLLASGESCIATTNRNFRGRMGERGVRAISGLPGHGRRIGRHGKDHRPQRGIRMETRKGRVWKFGTTSTPT